MSDTKKAQSYRISPDQIKMLDVLVNYYKREMNATVNDTFKVKVSKATVIELLIKERYHELISNGVINPVKDKIDM